MKAAALSLGLSCVPIAAGFSYPAAWTTTTTTTTTSAAIHRHGISTSSPIRRRIRIRRASPPPYTTSSLRYATPNDPPPPPSSSSSSSSSSSTTTSAPPLFRDFYAILGVSRSATSSEIKAAYRKLAKMYHPDANVSSGGSGVGGGREGRVDTTREFQAINRAYELLFDVEKRRKYDTTLVARENRRSGGAYSTNNHNGNRYTSTVDFVYGTSHPPNDVGGRATGSSTAANNDNDGVRRPFRRSSTDEFRKPHSTPPSTRTPEYYRTVIENFNGRASPPHPPPGRANDARTTKTKTTPPPRKTVIPTTTTTTTTNNNNNNNNDRNDNIIINVARMRAKVYDPVNDFIKTKPASGPTSPSSPPSNNDETKAAEADASSGSKTSRHPFQTTSTDQFKKPHVTPQSKGTPDYYRSVMENFNRNDDGGVGRGPAVGFAKRPTTSSKTTATKSSSKPITPIPPVKHINRTGAHRPSDAGVAPSDDKVSRGTATNRIAPNPPIPPPLRRTYGVGHVFESTQSSSGPRNRRKDDAVGRTDDNDRRVAETCPYSQRPTPSYSSTTTRVSASDAAPTARPPTQSYSSTTQTAGPTSSPMPENGSSSTDASPDEYDLRSWDEKLETARSISPRTLLRVVGWPLRRDPPDDDGPEFPILAVRVGTTALAALSTRHLTLLCGNSPVLAASAITLLVSTCLDRRLGRIAMCGSLVGMSGGHLTPDLSSAVALAGLTSLCYEVVIKSCNAFRGVGGRLGATAFLATSALAYHQGVNFVGRKLRRGLWKSGSGPSTILVSMVLYHVLGAVATILLRESSDDDSIAADPVRACSVVGLLGSLFLKDPTAILALYGGSFVGMSLPSRLMHGNVMSSGGGAGSAVIRPQTPLTLFGSFAGAGALAGLFHALTIRYGYWNGGWGGKAGLCAFAGCWAYRGFGNAIDFLRKKRKI
jgi:curved DNA-binding protein CbpA